MRSEEELLMILLAIVSEERLCMMILFRKYIHLTFVALELQTESSAVAKTKI